MAQTNVGTLSPLAVKRFSASLFANTLRGTTVMDNLMGKINPSYAMKKLAGQTSPGMPIVRIDDLSSQAGDLVSVDLVDTLTGKPLMGDVNREGMGDKLVFSSMDVKINLSSKVVDAGGTMSQKRTVHKLREIALAQLNGYFPRLYAQSCLVHLSGARGSQTGVDWVVPLSTDPDFGDIVVNAIKAPTYSRHYVVNGTGLTKGGIQLNSIVAADQLKLVHLDKLRNILDDLDLPLQAVQMQGDRAAMSSKMWVFLASPSQYSILLTEGSLRAFQQNAVNRSAYFDTRHPLFAGEVGMWNGILVVKNDRAIRFGIGESVQYVAAADAATATESTTTINGSLGAGNVVERGILLGAQALACAFGRTEVSGMQYGWRENLYNFQSNREFMGEVMCGHSKTRFKIDDGTGTKIPTDFGVIVVDSAVPAVT